MPRAFWSFFHTLVLTLLAWTLPVWSALAAMSDDDFLALCTKGTEQQIIDAIKDGANVNARSEHGMTPLMSAAADAGFFTFPCSRPEVVAALINAGADVNAQSANGRTALEWATYPTPRAEIFISLIDAGAKISEEIINSPTYRDLYDETGQTVVGDETGQTLFMTVMEQATPKMAAMLIEAGGKINEMDNDGRVPLMYAAAHNPNPDTLTVLLKAGAANNLENAWAALVWAAWENPNPAVLAALINAGVNINAQDEDGRTALMAAAGGNPNPEVMARLLELGANPLARDAFGLMAIDYANNNQDLAGSPALANLASISRETGQKSQPVSHDFHGEDAAPYRPNDENRWYSLPFKNLIQRSQASVGHGVDVWRYRPFAKDSEVALPASPPSLQIASNYPRLDGAIAVYPLYAAFAQAVYAGLDEEKAHRFISCSNTVEAYWYLFHNSRDIFFGVAPSQEQRNAAASMGLTLTEIPIGREAFIFFTHKDNPVRSLTQEQIRAIYSGRSRNWKDFGGPDGSIFAFQRPEGSGSQTAMLNLMKGENMARPLREEMEVGMGDIILAVAEYRNQQNAIGYSFRWYATALFANPDIRLLAIDGIEPSPENIRNGTYPFIVPLLAVTARPLSPKSESLLAWILGPEGQDLLERVGYVALQ